MKVLNCQIPLAIAYAFVILAFSPALCQQQLQAEYELNFHELEGAYGRQLGKIRNITQDPYGFMWFSGEDEKCIYRYDGNKLTLYRKDNFDTNSLGGVNINVVYADNDGIIWVGFGGAGLDAFNPATNTFTHFRHDDGNPKSIVSDNVMSILKDSQGRMWIGTDLGLDQMNVATGEFTHFAHQPGDNRSLSNNFVFNIYEDRQGVIWVATAGYPWYVPDPSEGGLNRLEKDGTFTRFMHDPNDEHSLISNHVLALYEDSRGTFWVGTHGDGLHTMDRKTGRFERHLYDPSNPSKLSRPRRKTEMYGLGDVDIITFITEDHSGAIWIGTLGSGLTRYDPENTTLTRYENSNGYKSSTTWNGFVSRDGVLWVANQENKLYRVDPIRKVIERKNIGYHISRFLSNDDGTFWAGSDSGRLLKLDEKGNLVKPIPITRNGENVPVADVHRKSEHLLWLGTSRGLVVFDTKTEKYEPLDFGFEGGLNIKILQDQTYPDWKWVTTLSGGLVKCASDGRVIKRYIHDDGNPSSIASDHIIQLTDDKEYLWVATDAGVTRVHKKTDTLTNYLNLKGTSLFKDSRGVLWAGSENGLLQYDLKSNRFKQTEYHSVIATDRTYAITEDDMSNLWVVTPSTIVRIDSSREVISQFGSQNGIEHGSITPGALFKTDQGTIMIGNYDGFYRIDPNEFNKSEQSPDVLFTEFLLPGAEKSTARTNLLKTPVKEIAPVTLRHNQNTFSIGLLLPDYREPKGNHFEARLLGYDDTWRELTSQSSSNYFSVPPGGYTYQVRAYTYSGSVTEKSIAIVISPPWWKTWWANVSYGLFVIGLLIAARQMIVHEERLKANLQVEHLNFEKAKEVDRVKSSFFTNISHEFRTPLTLIKGPVQELMEKYAKDSKTTAKLKLIQRNSDLLLKLINQLLDLARVEAGTLKLEKSESDIYSVIRAIANSFDSFARQKRVALAVEVPIVEKAAVFDRDKLETIMINLINNAIKFTPSGGSVHLNARVENSSLWLSVKDTGIGISKEHQERIFERFHQVSEAHKEVGTGIGLSLVKELVSFMGGTIELNSEQGNGSEFVVRLPIELATADSAASTEVAQPVAIEWTPESSDLSKIAPSNGQNGKQQLDETKPHILVVEDNADVRSFIIDSLGSDYYFLEAENGLIGLENAISEIPDMIISDVMMPEMDGILMTEKIKADIRTSHIPLILLTAKSTEDSKLHGLQTGADDYLTKPFNKNELLLKVRNGILRQQKLREKLRAEIMSVAPRVEVMSQDERFLNKVKEKIIERLSDEQLSVESLGEDIGLSRSQLLRKITALTGISVNELIRKLRLQRAAQLIEQNWAPVAQIAYEVGFPNPSYFAKMFKEEFGVLPSVYYEKTGSKSAPGPSRSL